MAHYSQDLIDLFDDIVINPHNANKEEEKIEDLQIKQLEEFLKTSTAEKQTLTPEQNEEFKKLFDQYERNYKTDNAGNVKPKVSYHLSKENSDNVTPSCSRDFKLPPSLIEDELSVKVMLGKTRKIEKQHSPYTVDKPKVLTPKSNEGHNFNEDLIDEVLIEKNIEINNRKSSKAVSFEKENFKLNDFDLTDPDKKSNVDKLESSIEYEDVMNEIISKNDIKCYGVKNACKISDEQLKLKTKEEKEFIDTLVTKYNLTYLEAVKKVEKSFNKRSVLKSDLEKVNLTPGPTLYEKAIVLPKLMKLLEDRKLEKERKVERKLILGGGYSASQNTLDNTKKDIKTLLKSPKVQNVSKVINKEIASTSLESEQTNKDVGTINKILEPPILVMEDCNRERLIAFRIRRLFQNFIRTGNYSTEES